MKTKELIQPLLFPLGENFCETTLCLVAEKVYMQKLPDDPILEKTMNILQPVELITNYLLVWRIINKCFPYISSGLYYSYDDFLRCL